MADENQGAPSDVRQQRHDSRTSQTFIQFVRDLQSVGGFESEQAAVRAAAVVLTHLEKRLTGEEASDLNAQLPMKLVEILHEAHRPEAGKPVEKLHHDQFIGSIARVLGVDAPQAEAISRSVFATVRATITEGEAGDVASQLPQDLIPLWSQPV